MSVEDIWRIYELFVKCRGHIQGKKKGHFQNQCSKLVVSRDNMVNMAAIDSDDALVCCFKNNVEGRIMDSGASFHATYCKEKLERFKLRFGKDVRYISGLKRRLISVGQLDEEGYHVGFGDQQWKVPKGSLVVACGSMYMVEDLYEHVRFQRQRSRCTKGSHNYDTGIKDCSRSFGRFHANLQVKCLKFDNGGEYSS
nr:retrovirus-related Pol polyprotein from transposon TNT 1-94 [Tanacetum cinerariifolium]